MNAAARHLLKRGAREESLRGKMPPPLPGIKSGDKLRTMVPKSRGVGSGRFDRLFRKEIIVGRCLERERAGAYEMVERSPTKRGGCAPEYRACSNEVFANDPICSSVGEWNPSYSGIHRGIAVGFSSDVRETSDQSVFSIRQIVGHPVRENEIFNPHAAGQNAVLGSVRINRRVLIPASRSQSRTVRRFNVGMQSVMGRREAAVKKTSSRRLARIILTFFIYFSVAPIISHALTLEEWTADHLGPEAKRQDYWSVLGMRGHLAQATYKISLLNLPNEQKGRKLGIVPQNSWVTLQDSGIFLSSRHFQFTFM